MSLRDQRRVLEALYALSEEDPEVGVSQEALDERLGRSHGDTRTDWSLRELEESGYIDQARPRHRVEQRRGPVLPRITAKGLWAIGKGERPRERFLGR